MKENKSLAKNSVYNLIFNIVNISFLMISVIYVTHVLLPDTIGKIEIARNFVQYFVMFSLLGIPTYGLREISKYKKNKEETNKIYSELMTINFISTVIFSILYITMVMIIPIYRENYILFLIVGISIAINIINNSWLYEGLEEFRYISILNLIVKTISFLLLIFFVKNNDDYFLYAGITLVGPLINYIYNIIHSRNFVHLTFSNLNFKRHLKPIMYLAGVNLAIEIYTLIDVTMLGFITSKENIAYYAYAIKVYKIVLQLINSFSIVFLPRITLYFKENKMEEFNKLITRVLKIILILSIPSVIGILFTSDYLICLVFGNSYIVSASLLKILAWIIIISPIGTIIGSRICLITDNENKMIIPVVFGAIINLVLNSILIPKYMTYGAAIASVISELVVAIIYINYGKKYFKLINMKDLYFKEGIAIVVMILFLSLISCLKLESSIKTLIQIPCSIIIYFVTLLFFKEECVCEKANSIMENRREQ